MNREDWSSLAAFALIAEERSFTRAAARLGVSPSALSHTMRELEQRLRVQLLARSTRSVSTTEVGERLLARIRPALDEIGGAVDDLSRLIGRPSGHLRITASRTAARMVVAPALPRFVERHPDVVVEVLIETALIDIVERRFDAGIRLGESLEKDVVAIRVTPELRMAVVGTPEYFARNSKPTTPQDLRNHRCINFRFPSAGILYKWEFEKARRKVEVAVEGPVVFDDQDLILHSAMCGIGLAFVIDDPVIPLIKAGALTRVLEDWCPPFPGFFLYYPGRRQVSPALAAFIDAIRMPDRRSGR